MAGMDETEIGGIESIVRGMLHRAVGREYTVSQAAPEAASAEYLTGFAAGELTGTASTAALVLGMLTDESPTKILEEARAQAAVENAFPFDLHIEASEQDGELR